MPHRRTWMWLAALPVVFGTSCDREPSAPPASVRSSGIPEAKAPAAPRSSPPAPFCKDWPKPAFVLAATGQMHGYIEPCGCSEPQYGGIARRADLLRQIQQRGWDVAAFELGGSLKNSRQQSQFKFQTLMTALRDMRYKAFTIGTEELQLGAATLVSQDVPADEATSPDAMPFLSANIRLFDSPDMPSAKHRTLALGSHRIGVTAVYGEALKAKLGNVDPSEIQFTEPAVALRELLPTLQREKPDLLVLLCHASIKESQDLAKQFPEFRVVISTGPSEDPLSGNPEMIGSTYFVTVGHKGKYVGLIGYFPDDSEKPFRFDLVRLDGDRFANDPRMLEHMQFYQDMLRDAKLAETEPALRHPSGDTYVGAERCGECHTKAFAKWSTTGHANAFESLKTGRLGISRIYDPECLSCHVTGWHPQDVVRYESGYLNAEQTPHLFGNQCENCHGPGSRHIELVEADMLEDAKKLMRLTLQQAETQCFSCHDLDNSPHFDFEKYWKEIAHPGRD